jgi:nucleoside-diphosphate-sugar epimerase
MKTALIGFTGFVGSNLLRQKQFNDLYNSKNIDEICGKHYDLLFISALPAAKWLANQDPEKDKAQINKLARCLEKVQADQVLLISTIDVYPNPVDVNEETEIEIEKCQTYGKHRLEFEFFVKNLFDTKIVRLPGLFGQGLKKNIIYDFLNNNNIEQIESRNSFQFYSLENIANDIDKVLSTNIKLLNLATEPVSVIEVAAHCLFKDFKNELDKKPLVKYDFRSIHANTWGGKNGYLYSKNQVLSDLEQYVSTIIEAR